VDGPVPLRVRGSSHHPPYGDRASLAREGKRWPAPLVVSQNHMHLLHLSSRRSLLHVEVQPDERKRQSDRPGLLIDVLRGPRIHDVLMDEWGIAMSSNRRPALTVRPL